jgi:photosystem II stability/assembly factor-like uncharacterized protein
MKKLIYTSIFFVLTVQLTLTQWVTQYSGTHAGLAAASFINSSTGWICGDLKTILKTTNGGQNWITQITGGDKILLDIIAIDSLTVYCVGTFQTILKTTNGGQNWMTIREGIVGQGNYYWGVSYINHNTGWIASTMSWVLRTTNGGMTFDSSQIPTLPYILDIYFKDSLNGLIACDVGKIYKTTNGGINWKWIYLYGETSALFDFSFIGNTGWVAGWQNRKIYKTTNFGDSWDSLGRADPAGSWWATALFFSSINTGWASGEAGNIWKSTNGGVNWYKQSIPNFVGYGELHFINDSIGWACGSIGTILHTTTSGQFVNINSQSSEIINDFRLYNNFPNPFNSSTVIEFDIKEKDYYKLCIYDVLGRMIEEVISNYLEPGSYKINYNAGNLSSGIYFYVLSSVNYSLTKKFTLIK